jgi:hypothetical protein
MRWLLLPHLNEACLQEKKQEKFFRESGWAKRRKNVLLFERKTKSSENQNISWLIGVLGLTTRY